MEDYIADIDKAANAKDVAKAMNRFANGTTFTGPGCGNGYNHSGVAFYLSRSEGGGVEPIKTGLIVVHR